MSSKADVVTDGGRSAARRRGGGSSTRPATSCWSAVTAARARARWPTRRASGSRSCTTTSAASRACCSRCSSARTSCCSQRQQKLYATPGPLADKWRAACDFLDEDIHSGYVRVLWELWAAGLADEDLAAGWRSAMGGWRRLLESVFAAWAQELERRAAALPARPGHARRQPVRGHRDRAARRRARRGRAPRRGARRDRRAHRARRVQALTSPLMPVSRRAMDSARRRRISSGMSTIRMKQEGGDPLGRRPDGHRLADGGARHAGGVDGAEHDPPRPRRLGRAAGVDGQRLQPELRRAADDRRGARRPLRAAQPLRRRPGALRGCVGRLRAGARTSAG